MFSHSFNYRDQTKKYKRDITRMGESVYRNYPPQLTTPSAWADSMHLRPDRWTGVAMPAGDGIAFDSAGRGLYPTGDPKLRAETVFPAASQPHFTHDPTRLYTIDARRMQPVWTVREMRAREPAPLVHQVDLPILPIPPTLTARRQALDAWNDQETARGKPYYEIRRR